VWSGNRSVTDGAFLGWVSSLARAHSRKLASVARAEGLGAEDSLDAVQDALRSFLLLPQARSLVEDAEESSRLLSVLVRNVARNMRRRTHRAAPHVPIGDEMEGPADEPSADDLVERAEQHVRLLGCVSRLGELQRHVVVLRMFEELSGVDAAERLGISPAHVAVQLHRAKRSLLACLLG
jgi:RNA polymerase sigma factor (sigma-70 family)